MKVISLHRYPVKGLSPERLDRLELTAGDHVPGDRLFAVENGPSGFDPAHPQHQPKIKFLMLMRDEALARLRTRYDDESSTLFVSGQGADPQGFDLSSQDGRRALETFMQERFAAELRGPPKLLGAVDGFRFTDSRRGYASLINRATLREIERIVGVPLDPLRFRANLLVDGLPAWAEFDLVGDVIEGPSGVALKGTKRITRCAATNVDPATARRDLDIPKTLMTHFGHADCGIYLDIVEPGGLTPGDTLLRASSRQASLPLDG